MAHLGNTYARMEYLDSLRARHGAQEETVEDRSTDLAMSRGSSRACHDDGAIVSDEAFEEEGPILHLPVPPADASDGLVGLVGSYQETVGGVGYHGDSAPPIAIPARSRSREPVATVAVDVPETAGPGLEGEPPASWGVPPSRPRHREPQATIAVDMPHAVVPLPPRSPLSTRGAVGMAASRPEPHQTIAVDLPEAADPMPACDPTMIRRPGAVSPPRPDPFRTIAVEVPEAGLPQVRPARREAGTADPRQTLAVDLPEECPDEEELPADRIRTAAIRQVHANGKLMEKMRAALFR